MPPPSVSPPTPVCETLPAVVASPCCCVATSRAPRSAPPWTHARRRTGSTRTAAMGVRSIIVPPSGTDSPSTLWPPHRTPTSRSCSRAARTAARTSSTLAHRTIVLGSTIDHRVPDLASLVVAGVTGQQQLARRGCPWTAPYAMAWLLVRVVTGESTAAGTARGSHARRTHPAAVWDSSVDGELRTRSPGPTGPSIGADQVGDDRAGRVEGAAYVVADRVGVLELEGVERSGEPLDHGVVDLEGGLATHPLRRAPGRRAARAPPRPAPGR